MNKPKVFLSLTADGEPIGRLVFELDSSKAPKTAENFRLLCTGQKGFGYSGCLFYRVIPHFCACVALFCVLLLHPTIAWFQSGDFETNNKDRTGGRSTFDQKYFDDEHNDLSHNSRGVLSMDNYGWPNTNSSRFFVTFDKCQWMDGYHVAFGKLLDGFETLDRLESFGTIEGYGAQKGLTTKEIRIEECGQLDD